MAIACKFCVVSKGLKGSEIASLPQTDEELFKHLEAEHHIPVRREGETAATVIERFYREQPLARDPKTCKCPACQSLRAEGAI